jgi:hypothetical protein
MWGIKAPAQKTSLAEIKPPRKHSWGNNIGLMHFGNEFAATLGKRAPEEMQGKKKAKNN